MPWSPSSVNTFLSCPRLWKLQRLQVKMRPQSTEALDLGTEFHAAMARWWHYWQEEHFNEVGPFSENALVDKACRLVVKQEGAVLLEDGVAGIEVNLDGDDEEAARHGRYPGTCDLITYNAMDLTVTDYKTKYKMEAKYADGELRETQRSWQFKQYAWFVQEKYQRPVTHVRKLLVAFTPALKVWLQSYPVTQHELSAWHVQAQRVWALMDEVEALASFEQTWQNDDSCERYGWNWRCGAYEMCWDGETINFEGA